MSTNRYAVMAMAEHGWITITDTNPDGSYVYTPTAFGKRIVDNLTSEPTYTNLSIAAAIDTSMTPPDKTMLFDEMLQQQTERMLRELRT